MSEFWDKINADYQARGGVVRPEVWREPRHRAAPAPGSRRGVGGAPRRATSETDQDMRQAYEAGASLSELAAKFGGSRTGAGRAVVRAGGVLRSRKNGIRMKRSRIVLPEEEAEFCRRYQGGESTQQIGRDAGLDPDLVRRILVARGTQIRTRSEAQMIAQRHRRKITDEISQQMRARYDDGASIVGLAKQFGFHRKQVTQALAESGATMRSRADAVRLSNKNRHNQPGE